MADNPQTVETIRFQADSAESGRRLDIIVADRIPSISRSLIGSLIKSGQILVDARPVKAGFKVRGGEDIAVSIPEAIIPSLQPDASVPFDVLFEDAHIVVLSKPPGVVVHPACGHQVGTLVHGLLAHCPDLSVGGEEGRPGIVHRLDKDTSGIMLIAKNDAVHQALSSLFKDRQIKKVYNALVEGNPGQLTGRISQPVGRHPVNRKKMAVRDRDGRHAVTCWKLLQSFGGSCSYLELSPETGRTHQIRVHLAHIGLPIVGDALYGRQKKSGSGLQPARQCLHATSLSFIHPVSGKRMDFFAPLWPDMAEMLKYLEDHRS